MRYLKATIAYDGSAYCGWQIQADQPSVQQTLEAAVERITEDVEATTSILAELEGLRKQATMGSFNRGDAEAAGDLDIDIMPMISGLPAKIFLYHIASQVRYGKFPTFI